MADVGFSLVAKMPSHEAAHLGALKETLRWAHPDVLDDSELEELACLLNRSSISLSHSINERPLTAKSVGSKAMLVHFGLSVR